MRRRRERRKKKEGGERQRGEAGGRFPTHCRLTEKHYLNNESEK